MGWSTLPCRGLTTACTKGLDKSTVTSAKLARRSGPSQNRGGRFLVIYDGMTVIQIILNEPGQAILHQHLKARQKYFKKFEPRAELRDTIPVIPKRNASVRIRATCPILSRQIWESVLGEQEGGSHMDALEALAHAAVEENRGADRRGLYLDTGAAARAHPNSATAIRATGAFTNVEREDL